jgi:ppGpp synthetase/RelA/SpoT-type nucleotidyltranferase
MDFVFGMDNPNQTTPKQEEERSPENIRARVKRLAEKTASLNESLDRVRENLKEASAKPRSSE